ncbi:hypothetical protein MRX96_039545 [Rhipicephalus microplus]
MKPIVCGQEFSQYFCSFEPLKVRRSVAEDLFTNGHSGFVRSRKKKKLKKHIRAVFDDGGAECFTLTTDGWTSRAGDSCVYVTAHMMDRDFRQHAYALACKPIPQEHTGENIVQFLQDVIEEWGLPDNIPTFFITDNSRNFVSAVAKSNWSGLLCFAHTLQLCINDAKREVASFSQLCAKCRSIVGRYKRSARARLMDIQKDVHMAQHEVIQDVPTRWNSEYAMMERLVELRAPISVELCNSDVDNLSSREWKLMAAAVKCCSLWTKQRQSCARTAIPHFPK